MVLDEFCAQSEGFGPGSFSRTLDFTPCFEDIVISLVPNVILILASLPRDIYLFHKAPHILQKTWLYWAKIATLAILLILKLVLISLLPSFLPLSRSAIVSNIIGFFTLIALIPLTHFEHLHTIRPAPFLLSYWLITIIVEAIQIRTYVSVGYTGESRFIIFVIIFAVSILAFALENFTKRSLIRDEWVKSEKASPERTANWFSGLTFLWLMPLLNKGKSKYLDIGDMWDLNTKMESDLLYQRMQEKWDNQKSKGRKPSIYLTLFKTFGGSYFLAMIPRMMIIIFTFLKPTLISNMIVFINSYTPGATDDTTGQPLTPQPVYIGFCLAAGLFLINFLGAISNGVFNHLLYTMGVKVRGALVGMIYAKSMKVRAGGAGLEENWKGEIVNYMSGDLEKLTVVWALSHEFWAGIIEVIIALWLLYEQVGFATFAALGVFALSLGSATIFSGPFAKWQRIKMERMGERIQKMTELISNIKAVKLNGYEPYFIKRVTDARKYEVDALQTFRLKGMYYIISANMAGNFLPIVTFGVYAGIALHGGGILDVRRIFTALSILQLLSIPVYIMGLSYNRIIGAQVSLKRISSFLDREEIDLNNVTRRTYLDPLNDKKKSEEEVKAPLGVINEIAVEIKDGSFAWNKEGEEFKLDHINLRIQKGTTLGIVGRIGEGKSTLIESIIGETYKLSGSVVITGSVAYVPQVPWILNATLRDNIVFGRPWDEEWYRQVIDACALNDDIKVLAHGDNTLIGEKGINLSGGQKQRVSIARAVYSKADVYLLDDPLSALDVHVGQQVFEHVIVGLLASKTCLIVTHSIHYLSDIGYIITLKKGQIVEQGTYEDLMKAGGEFQVFINDNLKKTSNKSISPKQSLNETLKDDDQKHTLKESKNSEAEESINEESEVKQQGEVPFSVYLFYFRAMGWTITSALVIAFFAACGIDVAQQYWIKGWGEFNSNHPNEHVGFYLGIYTIFVIASFFSVFASIGCLFVLAVPTASQRLHDWELYPVIRSSMRFFDTISTGKIINRFSSDIISVDDEIPGNFLNFTSGFTQILGSIIITCLATPFFIIVLVPLGGMYYLVQRFYLFSSREIRRLDSATKSPLYGHLGETLAGLSSVRAYGDQARLTQTTMNLLNISQKTGYLRYTVQRWLQMMLDLLSTLIVSSFSLIAVLTRNSASAGSVGVALANLIFVTYSLDTTINSYTMLEQNTVAVERIKEYSELPSEGRDIIPDSSLSKSWPENGGIFFDNYSTQYRDDLEQPVLKNLSFKIQPGEKIGIVGRTGAGKSSITMALLRIINPTTGTIYIDDQDITQIGLQDLRSRISIIAQDPFLWGATIRENLDPLGEHTDEEIWKALEQTSLKEVVSNYKDKLEYMITNGGENFSLGQKQLFSLARVLLRKTTLLLMDEATAAIDLETDKAIQRTIRTQFSNCTVLTIAHRIQTIMDSDRILVLQNGEMVEFDTPKKLLMDKEGIFYGLALQSGQISS